MNLLKNRLDAHFASASALALGAALVGAEQRADAHIVWSGIVNINIPSTSNGVYLNVVTGQSATAGAGASGWDVNPWSSSDLNFFNPNNVPIGGAYVTGLGAFSTRVDNLAFNTLIGPGQGFGSGSSETSGATAFNLGSSQNLVGFRFVNEATGTTHYGWMRLQLWSGPAVQPRSIVEFAYETQAGVGINAGVIPAPGALALLGIGGLLGSRRRRR